MVLPNDFLRKRRKRRLEEKKTTFQNYPRLISILLQHTSIKKEEVSATFSNFLEKHPEGNISKEEFSSMMKVCYPSMDINKLEKHIFRMYDGNGDGQIDFKEFMMILYIMSAGTPEENLTQIFRIFDKDNDGSITEKEMVKLVRDLCRVFEMASRENDEEAGECQKLFKQNSKKDVALMAFKEMDKDSDGKVTKEEFIAACYKEKSVSNLFALKIIDLFIVK